MQHCSHENTFNAASAGKVQQLFSAAYGVCTAMLLNIAGALAAVYSSENHVVTHTQAVLYTQRCWHHDAHTGCIVRSAMLA